MAFLFLCGCATRRLEFVQQNRGKKAVVRFAAFPGSSNVDSRSVVKSEAAKFCAGDYKIKSELQAIGDAGPVAMLKINSGTIDLGASENRLASFEYVEFVCQ